MSYGNILCHTLWVGLLFQVQPVSSFLNNANNDIDERWQYKQTPDQHCVHTNLMALTPAVALRFPLLLNVICTGRKVMLDKWAEGALFPDWAEGSQQKPSLNASSLSSRSAQCLTEAASTDKELSKGPTEPMVLLFVHTGSLFTLRDKSPSAWVCLSVHLPLIYPSLSINLSFHQSHLSVYQSELLYRLDVLRVLSVISTHHYYTIHIFPIIRLYFTQSFSGSFYWFVCTLNSISKL